MDSPENIIYVILIVGSIIWSIIKKFIGKKAETVKPKHQPAPTHRPQRTLEDIFRDLAGEIEPQQIPQPVAVEPVIQSKPQHIMNDALALEKRIVPRQLVAQELPPRNFAVNLEDANDWQRAFVYSEIFNRKY